MRSRVILSHKGGFIFFLVMKSKVIADTEGSHSSPGALMPPAAATALSCRHPKRHEEGGHLAAGTKPVAPAWPSSMLEPPQTYLWFPRTLFSKETTWALRRRSQRRLRGVLLSHLARGTLGRAGAAALVLCYELPW